MTDNLLLSIARICLELERPHNREAIEQKTAAAAAVLGGSTYLLGVRGAIRPGKPAQFAITNLSKAWQEKYDAGDLAKTDPYLRRAQKGFGPFRWDEVTIEEDDREYQAFLAAEGMRHGLICSTPTLNGFLGLVMIADRNPFPKEAWPVMSAALHLFTAAATRMAIYNLERENPAPKLVEVVELQDDERPCLELSAQGRTDKQIAEELGIKLRSVRYSMDRVAAKLNVNNRKAAIAEALARGLIHQRHFDAPRFKGAVR